MKRNSRLSLALHTLSHMAGEEPRFWTSSEIADHAGTNPVVVRRVLGKLKKAGLLLAEKGHSGGWQIAKPPQDITLADIYLALEERLVASEEPEDPACCSVENAMQRKVQSVLAEIETSLVERLSETSISDFNLKPHKH